MIPCTLQTGHIGDLASTISTLISRRFDPLEKSTAVTFQGKESPRVAEKNVSVFMERPFYLRRQRNCVGKLLRCSAQKDAASMQLWTRVGSITSVARSRNGSMSAFCLGVSDARAGNLSLLRAVTAVRCSWQDELRSKVGVCPIG